MKLLESKEILAELVKESEELMTLKIGMPDHKDIQYLHLGLLSVQCNVLKDTLAKLETK